MNVQSSVSPHFRMLQNFQYPTKCQLLIPEKIFSIATFEYTNKMTFYVSYGNKFYKFKIAKLTVLQQIIETDIL
jgi:hypothetical protein